MAFRIATNVSALNTQRWLGVANAGMAKSLERLSSGYKINKASDDSAGVAISTKMNAKYVSLAKAIDTGNQGLAMLQTAEGGIEQISNILIRLKELATQSASSNTTDRTALDQERSNLEAEISKIASNTKFGSTSVLAGANTINGYGASLSTTYGIEDVDVSGAALAAATNFTLTVSAGATTTLSLYNGSTTQTVTVTKPSDLGQATANFSTLGVKVTINASVASIASANGFSVSVGSSSFTYQVGDENQTYNRISASIKNFAYNSTDVLNLSGDLSSAANAQTYLDTVDTAIGNLPTDRGKLGAAMNQISYHVANLESMYENTRAANATIKDADFALEMSEFTKFQVISQSGIAMLAQANQVPQLVLSLLK